MVYLPFKGIQTFPVREIPLRCESEGGYQEPAVSSAPILCFDIPLVSLFVELCASHLALKGDILFDVQLLIDIVKILP